MTMPRRPPHVITREEAAAWLADSAVQVITVHRTDPASAHAITTEGVDIARTTADAGWGQAFYSGTRPDPQYGDATVRVAVRLQHPLILNDVVRDIELVEELRARTHADNIRDAVLAAGYDGVVVHFGPGDMWVVAYRNDQVKVVVEGVRRG